jgi:hypothetical protein
VACRRQSASDVLLWWGLTGWRRGATFLQVADNAELMAKKNIYIKDDVYSKMSAEAERRGISFSHVCSLAFASWLDTVKQVRSSLDKHYGPKKDPSETR